MMISIWWCIGIELAFCALFLWLLYNAYFRFYEMGVRDGAFYQSKPRVKEIMISHNRDLAVAMFAAKSDVDHCVFHYIMKKAETDGEFV